MKNTFRSTSIVYITKGLGLGLERILKSRSWSWLEKSLDYITTVGLYVLSKQYLTTSTQKALVIA